MKKNIISQKLKRSVLTVMLSLSIIPGVASAAIAPDVSAPNVAVNVKDGVEIININEANANGLSHNVFTQFDVSSSGAVFNNSVNDVNSQLAGMINGNSNFVNGIAAQTILNEVVSNNPSSLNGIMEIAGQKANLIIANQKGITGNGLGFINTDRAILTTGNPVINEAGALSGFNVTEGVINMNNTINSKGTDSLELIGKSIKINGKINANDLKIISGCNNVTYADLAYNNIATETSTGYAIDIANYGGMNANNIYIISTDSGLGVKNNTEINSINDLQITSNGDIENNGTMYSHNSLVLNSNGTIINSNKEMLQISASGDIILNAENLVNEGKIFSGYNENGSWNNSGKLELNFNNTSINLTGDINSAGNLIISSNYDITNNGTLLSGGNNIIDLGTNGTFTNNTYIAANGNINITANNVTNNGDIIGGYDLSGGSFSNIDSAIDVNANIKFMNSGSILANGNINILSGSHLINTANIYSRSDVILESENGSVYSYNFEDDDIIADPFIGARGSISITGENIYASGKILSASLYNGEGGYIASNEPNRSLKLNSNGVLTVEGDAGCYIGNVELKGNDVGIMSADIFSRYYSNSNLAQVAVLVDGTNGVQILDSNLLSDGGYKLNSNSGSVSSSNCYFANEGNNFGSFFGNTLVKFNGGIYTTKGKMMINAPRIENLGSTLFSKEQINIFATGITSPYIKNTGNIMSHDSVSMYVPSPGYFDNTDGFITGANWVQLTGSPTLSNNNPGLIASDTSIQLYVTNAAVSYPLVAAPTVLINGRGQGTLDRWVAYLDENGLIHYALTGLSVLPSPLYSTLAAVSDDVYMMYKGDFTDPKNLENFEKIQVNNVLEAIPNDKISKVAIVAYKVIDTLYYRGYLLAPGQYFGSYDAETGGRIFNDVSADKFYEDITFDWNKNLDETGNEIAINGIVVRTSADGTVTATISSSNDGQIVYFNSPTQSFSPFNNVQVIRFNNTI